MGLIYADVELSNAYASRTEQNATGSEEVRCMEFKMLVDTGAIMLAINEEMQAYFKFDVQTTRTVEMADGQLSDCLIVGPVKLRFKNRDTICKAIVLPGNTEPLLGALPLEEMDVLIDPLRQRLIINPLHPDGAHYKIPAFKLLPADTAGPAIL